MVDFSCIELVTFILLIIEIVFWTFSFIFAIFDLPGGLFALVVAIFMIIVCLLGLYTIWKKPSQRQSYMLFVFIVFLVGFIISVCYCLWAFIDDRSDRHKAVSVLDTIFAAIIALFCFLTWLEYRRGK